MKFKFPVCLALISATFASCIERSYFVNPGYGNAMPYHALPAKNDSAKNNLYLNGSLMAGGANYDLNDDQYALNANLYNANSFSNFKIWYGAGLTLGLYNVNKQDYAYYDTTASFNNLAGNKFYGSVNGNAGIAYALQLGNVEWRILGFQLTAQQEFGNFQKFRNELYKESISVDGNIRNTFLITSGLSTEICIGIPIGTFNIFQQYNLLTGSDYRYYTNAYTNSATVYKHKRYDYFSSAYSITTKNLTYYIQQNVTPFWHESDDGPRVFNIQLGIDYRLPYRKK